MTHFQAYDPESRDSGTTAVASNDSPLSSQDRRNALPQTLQSAAANGDGNPTQGHPLEAQEELPVNDAHSDGAQEGLVVNTHTIKSDATPTRAVVGFAVHVSDINQVTEPPGSQTIGGPSYDSQQVLQSAFSEWDGGGRRGLQNASEAERIGTMDEPQGPPPQKPSIMRQVLRSTPDLRNLVRESRLENTTQRGLYGRGSVGNLVGNLVRPTSRLFTREQPNVPNAERNPSDLALTQSPFTRHPSEEMEWDALAVQMATFSLPPTPPSSTAGSLQANSPLPANPLIPPFAKRVKVPEPTTALKDCEAANDEVEERRGRDPTPRAKIHAPGTRYTPEAVTNIPLDPNPGVEPTSPAKDYTTKGATAGSDTAKEIQTSHRNGSDTAKETDTSDRSGSDTVKETETTHRNDSLLAGPVLRIFERRDKFLRETEIKPKRSRQSVCPIASSSAQEKTENSERQQPAPTAEKPRKSVMEQAECVFRKVFCLSSKQRD